MDISMESETISKTTLKMIIKNNQEALVIQVIYQGLRYLRDTIACFQKNKKFS